MLCLDGMPSAPLLILPHVDQQSLAILIQVCAAIHYLWKVKVMIGSPVYYAVAIGVLLAFRLFWQLRSAKSLKTQRVPA